MTSTGVTNYNTYNDRCPNCENPIYLIRCTIEARLPIFCDGWSFSNPDYLDTKDEKFLCETCNCQVPSEWVFMSIDKKKAKRIMAKRMLEATKVWSEFKKALAKK